MPEPLLYIKAMGIAAIVSALFVFSFARWGHAKNDSAMLNKFCVFGIGLGLTAALYVLRLNLTWPPANGLDRLLSIVVPITLFVELLGGFKRTPEWLVWCLRFGIALLIPRILLHNSVYVRFFDEQWTRWHAFGLTISCSLFLVTAWRSLYWLQKRWPGISILSSLSLTTLCAGITIMMAGYVQGGAVAFPVAMSLAGVTLAHRIIEKHANSVASLGFGVVSLFGVLFIGRFFGRLSTSGALVLMCAPLLCWIAELRLIKRQKPWVIETVRVTLVAILLLIVLMIAKRTFDREMAPLL